MRCRLSRRAIPAIASVLVLIIFPLDAQDDVRAPRADRCAFPL